MVRLLCAEKLTILLLIQYSLAYTSIGDWFPATTGPPDWVLINEG